MPGMCSKAEKRRRKKNAKRAVGAFNTRPFTTPSQEEVKKEISRRILSEDTLKLEEDLSYDLAYRLWRRYKTVADLVKATEDDLLEMPGIGPAKVARVQNVLEKYGVSLAR